MSHADSLAETELSALCARLLCGLGDQDDTETLLSDPPLSQEITARLDACGVRLLLRAGETPVCVIDGQDEDLPDLALACLALCTIALGGPHGQRRPRIDVRSVWERVGKKHGYSQAYVRRAGLGPLEARGLIRVVRPDQRATGAYITAGPALAAIDRDTVTARLKALQPPA